MPLVLEGDERLTCPSSINNMYNAQPTPHTQNLEAETPPNRPYIYICIYLSIYLSTNIYLSIYLIIYLYKCIKALPFPELLDAAGPRGRREVDVPRVQERELGHVGV